jgi:23S rRNA U2552 (ribose-2'-O)-methylase RlmE/FtsJ
MGINSKDKRDVYYKLSKENGYRARSIYKLKDIDDSYDIFQGVSNVVDLCGAPGSWSQYVAEKMREKENKNMCTVDLQEIHPIEGVCIIKEDITTEKCVEKILNIFGNKKADLILCDGAPDITGIHDIDEYFQCKLVCSALQVSLKIGKIGKGDIGKGDIGKEDIGKEDIGKEDIGKEDIGKEDIGKGDIGKEDIGKEDIGKGDIGKGDIGKEDIGKGDIGKVGSSFISKIFRGKYCKYLVHHFRKFYKEVIILKPKSSRLASIECFIYCKDLYNVTDCPLTIKEDADVEDFEVIEVGKDPIVI